MLTLEKLTNTPQPDLGPNSENFGDFSLYLAIRIQ